MAKKAKKAVARKAASSSGGCKCRVANKVGRGGKKYASLLCQDERGHFKHRRFAKNSELKQKGIFCPTGGAPKRLGKERAVTPAMRRKAQQSRVKNLLARALGPAHSALRPESPVRARLLVKRWGKGKVWSK